MIACFNPDPGTRKAIFHVLGLGLKDAITHSLKPADSPGRARRRFWKAVFPQPGPVASEKALASPAVPEAGRTCRLGSLLLYSRPATSRPFSWCNILIHSLFYPFRFWKQHRVRSYDASSGPLSWVLFIHLS